MDIDQWLATNGDYATGVQLYMGSGKSKPNLVRLFSKKESPANMQKLKYELKKIVPLCKNAKKFANTQSFDAVATPVASTQQDPLPIQENSQPYKGLMAHEVPKELRLEYAKQKQLFLKACFLHADLKSLAPEQEVEALEISLQLEAIWDEIDMIWYQLDYYKEKRIVLVQKREDFGNLTPSQLLQRRDNTRSNLSKHEKTYKTLLENPPKTESLAVNKKYNDKLRHKEQTILKNKSLLLQLNKLIDGKT